jgi:ubiquinone/menaquinone biosynthesis C-methylase UbiE
MNDNMNIFADGEAYERLMGRWSRLIGDLFLDWLALPNGLRCIDVGCGNGAFTEVLIARGVAASVVGLDPSAGQIDFARERAGAKSAEFRIGDAQALPFGDKSFDAALMALVISFVPDPTRAVAEMARVVRFGGWVATYMWDIANGGLPVVPLYRAGKSLGLTTPGSANPAVSRREALDQLWQQAGLSDIETQVFRTNVVYADFDDFWDSNTVTGPAGQWVRAMDPETREQLRTRSREQVPIAADGSIRYEVFANAVRGRRVLA